MKKSKMIYLFNLILSLFLVAYFLNYKYASKYENETEVMGTIIKISKNSENTKLIVKAKEKIIVTCYKCFIDYKIGDTVKFYGEFKEVNENSNFNLFNYKKYLMSLGIYKNFVFTNSKYIDSSNNIIYKTYNNLNTKIEKLKSSYFLKAMILGDTSSFDQNIYENYKINGIIHLFAISGMHVGIIVEILTFFLKKLKFGNYSFMIIFPILIFYMLIINTASITRSVLMFGCLKMNKFFKISNINILFYLFVLNLIVNPYIIYNMGFCLSYVISFFLLLSAKKLNKIENYFGKLLFISLISFLSSFPILINSNFEFNLLTPLINVFIVPFVSAILFPLSLLTLLFPSLDSVLQVLLNGFNNLNAFLSNNSLMINVGYLNIYLIIIYYLFFIAFFIKSKHIYLLLGYFILLINLKNINFNTYLIMIDVGQGDSILAKNYYGENILFDVGSKENTAKNIIIPYLKSIGVTKLDKLIVSHGDYDHIAGAMDIINNIDVKEVYLNSYKNNSYEEEIIENFDVNIINQSVYLNDHIFIYNFPSSDENDDSLITYLIDAKVLLMGDASSRDEAFIDVSDINILKVGHHGSKTSSSPDFIDRIKPKISLISVALKNKYNHPAKEVLDNLKNSKVLMTSVNGMIKINLKNLNYETRF